MNQYSIVTESTGNIRALAREALAGKWKTAVIVALIYEICLVIPPMILNHLFGSDFVGDVTKSLNYGNAYSVSSAVESVSYTPLSGLYTFLVVGAFSLGMAIFFLSLFRRQKEDVAQVFSGFEHFVKALGLVFMMGLFIFLWTLLFIIPGIIASYRYSQAFLILADDPSKGVLQCITESKVMMRGNKWKFFVLDLTFIGWAILASIPVMVIDMMIQAFLSPTSLLAELLVFVAGAGVFWLMAYMQTAKVAFYDLMTGRLRPAISQGGYTDGFGGGYYGEDRMGDRSQQ